MHREPIEDPDVVRIDVESRPGGVQVIRIIGDVDISSVEDVRAELADQLACGHPVVLDLDGVSFMGSAGLAALIETHEQAGRLGLPWAVVTDSTVTRRPLDISGLTDVLPVFRTPAAALAAVSAAADHI